MTNNQKLVGRHKRLAFMKVGTEGTYDRITGFTSLIEGKEAKEYARQYIDEATERTDVVGYLPESSMHLTAIPTMQYMKRSPILQTTSFWV